MPGGCAVQVEKSPALIPIPKKSRTYADVAHFPDLHAPSRHHTADDDADVEALVPVHGEVGARSQGEAVDGVPAPTKHLPRAVVAAALTAHHHLRDRVRVLAPEGRKYTLMQHYFLIPLIRYTGVIVLYNWPAFCHAV